jgi:hypothetical protein
MLAVQRLRQAVADQQYRISSHANKEMSEDGLVAADIERVILAGRITRRFTRDPRGTRYEVTGHTLDGRRASVVCRFLPSGQLVIITAYAGTE